MAGVVSIRPSRVERSRAGASREALIEWARGMDVDSDAANKLVERLRAEGFRAEARIWYQQAWRYWEERNLPEASFVDNGMRVEYKNVSGLLRQFTENPDGTIESIREQLRRTDVPEGFALSATR